MTRLYHLPLIPLQLLLAALTGSNATSGLSQRRAHQHQTCGAYVSERLLPFIIMCGSTFVYTALFKGINYKLLINVGIRNGDLYTKQM